VGTISSQLKVHRDTVIRVLTQAGAERAERYGRFAAELQAAVAALGAPGEGRIAVASA
jgi:hypothetical protein